MSDALQYKGSILAWIHSYTGDDTSKFNIVMEGIGALEQLCKLSDEEILNVDGLPPMNYGEFKKQIISKAKRIYLSDHEYNIDFHSG
jgi:hypothetical protein